MDDDYLLTVEEAQARADALGSNQGGAWDDLATDALSAIANGSEPAREIATAVMSAHPRVFRYRREDWLATQAGQKEEQ